MKPQHSPDFVTEWCDQPESSDMTESQIMRSHLIETELAHQLSSTPHVDFDRLVVRRLPNNSICLEGSVRSVDSDFDIEDYVKCALGVDQVFDRLTRSSSTTAAGEETFSGEDTVTDWPVPPSTK